MSHSAKYLGTQFQGYSGNTSWIIREYIWEYLGCPSKMSGVIYGLGRRIFGGYSENIRGGGLQEPLGDISETFRGHIG